MRRVLGLVLAPQRVGDLGREAAQRLAGRVYDDPVSLAVCWCGDKGLHKGGFPRGEVSGRAAERSGPGSGPNSATCE